MSTAFVSAFASRTRASNLQAGVCCLVSKKLTVRKAGISRAGFCSSVSMTASYEKLADLCREISSIGEINDVLVWDENVMMQPGSAASRGKQKAAIAAILYDKQTSTELRDAIAGAKTEVGSLDEFQQAVVRDAERSYKFKVEVPKDVEKEMAELGTVGVQVWAKARKEDDFKALAPYLAKWVELKKKRAKATHPEKAPYDGAIDDNERGMSAARLAEIFDEITEPLKKLADKIIGAKGNLPEVHPALKGGKEWTTERQSSLSHEIAKAMGFDFNRGRIDVTLHPFMIGGISDTRIATRYNSDSPFDGIMGTMHEAGHGLYGQGCNAKYAGLPVSHPLSAGVHESQSLFWEMLVGRSEEFWTAVLPLVHAQVPHTRGASARDVFVAVNQVERGLIRVDADEVLYLQHVALRFEIERGLMDGSVDVEELPRVWGEKFAKYVGGEVPSDREGCLQDIHWAMGYFGYFPSYALGLLMAAQLFAFLEREAMPDIRKKVAKGEFADIKKWLNENVHEKGSLYPSMDDLLLQVTKERLNPKYLIQYLTAKYSALYNF